MHYLSEKQISGISERLKEQEINYSHLFEDLLDHVCCDIETCMQQGLEYKEALNKTFDKIGLNGLREIQEATIFYVKFNLLIMKKAMNVLAIIGSTILLLGLIFKLNHWPGGSLLFFFGILSLFLGFFPMALLNVRKEMKVEFFSKNFMIYLVGFATIVLTGAALLWSTMHWPAAKEIIVISIIVMHFVFFPMLFYRIIKTEKNRIAHLALVIFSFFFIGIIDVQTYNRQTSETNIIDNKGYENEINVYKKAIKSIVLSNTETGYLTKTEQLDKKLEELENLIVSYQKSIIGDYDNIYFAGKSFLRASEINAFHDNRFQILKGHLEDYKQEAQSLSINNEFISNIISQKLVTSDYIIDAYGNVSWERRNFTGHGDDKRIYTKLNKILLDVYHIHYEVLRNLDIKNAPELIVSGNP